VTSPAEDAPELPVTDQRRGIAFVFIFPDGLVFGLFQTVFVHEVLKTALSALVALGAIQGVAGEDEFQEFPPHLQEPVGLGYYGNAFQRRRGAGGHGLVITFHLYDAEAAGTNGEKLLMVTEGRDGDAPFPGCLEDRLALLGDNFFSVDG
jgi:hypothetical protein